MDTVRLDELAARQLQLDPATAAATREHEGITYYFCNPGCADKFDQDTARYIA